MGITMSTQAHTCIADEQPEHANYRLCRQRGREITFHRATTENMQQFDRARYGLGNSGAEVEVEANLLIVLTNEVQFL